MEGTLDCGSQDQHDANWLGAHLSCGYLFFKIRKEDSFISKAPPSFKSVILIQ